MAEDGKKERRAKKPFNVRVGKRIQAARKAAGITQAVLAERIGVAAQHLASIESGAAGTSFETLCKICMELSITTDQILMDSECGGTNKDSLQRLIDSIPVGHTENIREIILWYIDGMDKVIQGKETRP